MRGKHNVGANSPDLVSRYLKKQHQHVATDWNEPNMTSFSKNSWQRLNPKPLIRRDSVESVWKSQLAQLGGMFTTAGARLYFFIMNEVCVCVFVCLKAGRASGTTGHYLAGEGV